MRRVDLGRDGVQFESNRVLTIDVRRGQLARRRQPVEREEGAGPLPGRERPVHGSGEPGQVQVLGDGAHHAVAHFGAARPAQTAGRIERQLRGGPTEQDDQCGKAVQSRSMPAPWHACNAGAARSVRRCCTLGGGGPPGLGRLLKKQPARARTPVRAPRSSTPTPPRPECRKGASGSCIPSPG
jgi:hypothetical protein